MLYYATSLPILPMLYNERLFTVWPSWWGVLPSMPTLTVCMLTLMRWLVWMSLCLGVLATQLSKKKYWARLLLVVVLPMLLTSLLTVLVSCCLVLLQCRLTLLWLKYCSTVISYLMKQLRTPIATVLLMVSCSQWLHLSKLSVPRMCLMVWMQAM